MRRILVLTAVGAVALATAGFAVAHLKASTTEAVSADWSAARERSDTRTCTGSDGTFEITSGRYAGTMTATGGSTEAKAALTGPLVLQIKAVYNTTRKVGWLEGWVHVRKDGHDDRRSTGRIWATLGENGVVEGFIHGASGNSYAALYANVAASFTPTGGFVGGKLGSGGGSNLAVLAGRPCKGKPAPIAVKLVVKGAIESLSTTEIKVKPRDNSTSQPCAIKSGHSPSTSNFKVGDTVEMRCGLVENAMTLLQLKKIH